jgi:hypothetical protein
MATNIKANVRSPRYYEMAGSGSKTLNLKIWEGDIVSTPGTNTYTLTKDAVGGQAVFEIAELVRDYIDQSFTGTYSSASVWVKINSDTAIPAFDGYGYYSEGTNPSLSTRALISNTTIWVPQSGRTRIPVYTSASSNAVSSVKYYSGGSLVESDTITPSGQSAAQIAYPSSTATIDEVRVYYNSDASYDSFSVKYMDCSKYDTYKLTFVNKFGALQDLYFTGKSTESIAIQKDEYKANVLDIATQSYGITDHQYRNFDVKGRQSMILNTNNVSEDYNEPIKQLLLSEKVWMTIGSNVVPVNVNTSSLTMLTSLNDKMVNYTLEVDFAHDTIQNVR